MIDNHSYKIFNVFYIMSLLLANFYDDEHFLIVYFVISLDEDHFFEIKNNRSSLIIDFCELRKYFRYDKIENICFHYRFIIKFIMTYIDVFMKIFFINFMNIFVFEIMTNLILNFFFRFFLTKRLILRSFWKMHEQNVYKNLQSLWKFTHFYKILISISF
jgi:hypothetical protein